MQIQIKKKYRYEENNNGGIKIYQLVSEVLM